MGVLVGVTVGVGVGVLVAKGSGNRAIGVFIGSGLGVAVATEIVGRRVGEYRMVSSVGFGWVSTVGWQAVNKKKMVHKIMCLV